jgi:hypothetical protein
MTETMLDLLVIGILGFLLACFVIAVYKWVTEPRKPSVIEAKLEAWQAEAKREYDMLPPLGQARVDKRDAEIARAGGAVGAVGYAAVASAVNPTLWPVMLANAGRWAYKNWKEHTLAIEEADKRKAEILGGKS